MKYDHRMTAQHEAGHITAAWHYGWIIEAMYVMDVEISAPPSLSPSSRDYHWQCAVVEMAGAEAQKLFGVEHPNSIAASKLDPHLRFLLNHDDLYAMESDVFEVVRKFTADLLSANKAVLDELVDELIRVQADDYSGKEHLDFDDISQIMERFQRIPEPQG